MAVKMEIKEYGQINNRRNGTFGKSKSIYN